MKKLFFLSILLLFGWARPAHAQFTQVTATVTDPNGIPYAAGTVSAVLTPGSSSGFTLSGNPYSGRVGPAILDSTGSFTLNFGSNALITPASTQWQITVNSNPGGIEPPLGTGPQSFTVTMTISGATQNISSTLNAAAPKLTNFAGSGSGTIAGSIAASQVAFGTGVNTIGGDNAFEWTEASPKYLTIGDPLASFDTRTQALINGNCNGVSWSCVNLLASNSSSGKTVGFAVNTQGGTTFAWGVLASVECNNSTSSSCLPLEGDLYLNTPASGVGTDVGASVRGYFESDMNATATAAYGTTFLSALLTNASTGTITDLSGVLVEPANLQGPVTNFNGLHFRNPMTDTGVTNMNGVLIDALTGGSGTMSAIRIADQGSGASNFGINEAGTSTNNVLAKLTISSITGSTQCLHASAAGVVTGTGSDCGAGGGGVTSFTGDGTIITNSASTGAVTISLAGTSGGIPYFSSATAWASSAALTHFGVVYGGGAGGAPASTAADTTTTHALFATATAPAFRAIAAGDIPTLNQNTTGTAANLTGCTPSTAGDICYWNGSAWTRLAGNASGTNWLQETSAGVPSWTIPAGFANPMTTLGDIIYENATPAPARLAGPTATNGVPQMLISTPSGGAAVAPIWSPAGVPTNPQTGTTYTYVATDRASYVSFSNAGAIAVTLPQAGSTGFASNWVNVSCDIGTGTATITPTTSTISYSTGAAYTSAAATLALSTGQCAWIYSDNTNYFAIVRSGTGSGVTSFTGDGTIITNSASTGAVTISLAGTSGGIPYFSSATAWASSAALTHFGVVYGGGAGGAPASTAADTTTTHALFATATAPAFRAIAIGDLPSIPINDVVSATGAIATIADGNNPLVLNCALTSGTTCVTFGETTAATTAGAVELQVTTINTSTAIPLQITQGAGVNATNAPLALNVAGGTGGTNAGATNPGFKGGGITLTTGTGSNAGATSGTGGAGGDLTLTAGNGGTAAIGSTTGAGGNIILNPGAAGGTGTAGKIGVVEVGGANAGFVYLAQGSANTTTNTNIPANSIIDQAPTAVTAYAVTRPGTSANGIQTNNVSAAVITQGFSGDANHSTSVATGSGTSIGSTSLCSSANCPAGTYQVNAYLDITTACATTGSYIVDLIYTDDTGSKTVPINIQGTGTTPTTGSLALASTANFGQAVQVIRSTGAASINYSTTAGACGSGGPMVGKLYLSVEPVQ